MEEFFKNEIIRALAERKIDVILTLEGFKIPGFYRSGSILLVPDGEHFVVHARDGDVKQIETFDDLVYFNHSWWRHTNTYMDSPVPIESEWIPDMERLGLVKKVVTVEYK